MILVNTDYISDKKLETLGLVTGNTVQSKDLIKDIGSGLKTLVGGELGSYNKMMKEAREIATQRMMEEAEKLGADAIVNVKFTSSSVMQGASEILAYGTAVKFIK